MNSKGHVAVLDGMEYFKVGNGDLYRAPVRNGFDLSTGYRLGARFECTGVQADRYFNWLTEEYARLQEEAGR